MKFLKIAFPALALLIVPFLVIDGAHARGCPFMGMPANYSKITPEQKKVARALVTQAHEEKKAIEDQIYVKKNELTALHNASFPNVEAIGKKASEITDLRKKMRDNRKKLGENIDKALGLELGTHSFGPCMDMPKHKRGHDMRHGKGHGMRQEKMHHGTKPPMHMEKMGGTKRGQKQEVPLFPLEKDNPTETQPVPAEEQTQGL